MCRPHPDGAGAIDLEAERSFLQRGAGGETAIAVAEQVGVGREPHGAVRGFGHGLHGGGGVCEGSGFPVCDAEHAAGGEGEGRFIGRGGERENGTLARISAERNAAEAAGSVAHEAASGADPERAIACLGETGDVVALKCGLVFMTKEGEGEAIEAGQAAFGGDPEIAIAGLEDCMHAVLGETFFGGPDLVAEGGLCLRGGRRERQEQGKQDAPQRRAAPSE